MADGLDLGPEHFRFVAQEASVQVAQYFESLPKRRITPDATSEQIRAGIQEELPRAGCEPHALLDAIRDTIIPGIRHNGHPRFFGYVASPSSPITAIGGLVTAALNANVTAWRSAPAAVELEHLTIDWIKQMVGVSLEMEGLFVSGGSMANFAGIAAARSRAFPDANARGMSREAGMARIYASEEVHFSVPKAAAMLGIGKENVRLIGTDSVHRMNPEMLHEAIAEDVRNGLTPLCIVATAGTVATGAIDPLEDIADVAHRHSVWLHVDACYGGFAAMAPSVNAAFAHLSAADSIALDPHKWLYVPVDCGCVLYRDGYEAKRAFSFDAEYTRPLGFSDREAFAFWDYGPELSRCFRALNVWLQIKSAGTDELAAAIEKDIRCAKYFEQLVHAERDFKMLAPVELSIFCFRYAPESYSGDLDELNERTMLELQRRGSSYLSNARVDGHFALRGCVLNYRTEERDMRRLLEDVREAALAVLDGRT